jgi:branched-chain amino acid transport system ATP-binding protein/branched-chain amino acid transport system permease protein
MGDAARALIRSPQTRPALLFVLAIALYLAPFAVGTEYRLFIATQMAAYVLVAIGLNLLNGYGGQVSLGHGALVAIGAYTRGAGDGRSSLVVLAGGAPGHGGGRRGRRGHGAAGLPALDPVLRPDHPGLRRGRGRPLTEWRELTHGFAGVVGIPAVCWAAR